ncbi:MAG: putative phosphoribosyl transferase [Chloroflexota bacterium]|jgi:dienelactone hydrolase|nr:putative phosphoribosyl transferase [Chloroflexota bacterium]
MQPRNRQSLVQHSVRIPTGSVELNADLSEPRNPLGLVVFAHGSGSGRHSPRNRGVARLLHAGGFATLLMDLLTAEEEVRDAQNASLRFDVELLADRLVAATDWAADQWTTRSLDIGYFGASTGGGAALVAAAKRPRLVRAVVSRGGRPDLAGSALARVTAPTLLIVGGSDPEVLHLNERARTALTCTTRLEIVPHATHLFEERGTLERVAALATAWFRMYLDSTARLKSA